MDKLRPIRIDNIVEFLNKREFTVTWSGGKDSTATLLWVIDNVKHNNWDILYVEITGNTHPLCTQYVKEVSTILGVEDKLVIQRRDVDFYDYMVRLGIPHFGYRWCYNVYKEPFFKKTKFVTIVGMKRSDSRRRGELFKSPVMYSELNDKIWVLPILDWGTNQVLEYIKQHGIKINPCYELYGHGGNCMFCPFHTKDKIIKTMRDREWGTKIYRVLKYSIMNQDNDVVKRWLKIYEMIHGHRTLTSM